MSSAFDDDDLKPKQGEAMGAYSPSDVAARQAEEERKRLAAAKAAQQGGGEQQVARSSPSDSQKARDGRDGVSGQDGVAGRDGAPAPEKSKKWYDNTAVRVGLVALAIVTLPYSIYAVVAATVVAAAGAIVVGAAVGVYKGVKEIASWWQNRKKGSYEMNSNDQETVRAPASREEMSPHREQEQAVHHERGDPAAAVAMRRSSSVSVQTGGVPPAPPRVIPNAKSKESGRESVC